MSVPIRPPVSGPVSDWRKKPIRPAPVHQVMAKFSDGRPHKDRPTPRGVAVLPENAAREEFNKLFSNPNP